jgi:hypothetical protein
MLSPSLHAKSLLRSLCSLHCFPPASEQLCQPLKLKKTNLLATGTSSSISSMDLLNLRLSNIVPRLPYVMARTKSHYQGITLWESSTHSYRLYSIHRLSRKMKKKRRCSAARSPAGARTSTRQNSMSRPTNQALLIRTLLCLQE